MSKRKSDSSEVPTRKQVPNSYQVSWRSDATDNASNQQAKVDPHVVSKDSASSHASISVIGMTTKAHDAGVLSIGDCFLNVLAGPEVWPKLSGSLFVILRGLHSYRARPARLIKCVRQSS